MKYKSQNGIIKLGFELSLLEKTLMDEFSERLESRGFRYLSVPSIITDHTFRRQEIPTETLRVGDGVLAGSAEQGILEIFADTYVEPSLIYAKNACFRSENKYDELRRLKEFNKLEQFAFCYENDWRDTFELLLGNATDFLEDKGIRHRVVNMTEKDEGYHVLKYDIEIFTETYGWLESHSCTYFGEEQARRFGITGAMHTISNTGIASPRILIPFIEGVNAD